MSWDFFAALLQRLALLDMTLAICSSSTSTVTSITIYMEELDAYDHEEGRKLSKDEIQRKLDVCKERKERYEGYRDQLEESGESQISLTDSDSSCAKPTT